MLKPCIPALLLTTVSLDAVATEHPPKSAPEPGPLGVGTGKPKGGFHGRTTALHEKNPNPVRQESISTIGGISREVMTRLLRTRQFAVRVCYEKELAKARKKTGRLTLKFLVEKDGQTSHVSVAEITLHHAKFERCLTDAIKAWTFPKEPIATVTTWGFELSPPE